MLSLLTRPLLQVEAIGIDEESLGKLGEIGESASLRHAVQLLTPSQILAKTNGRDEIAVADVTDASQLFRDAKFTARILAEQADKYVH